MEEALSFFEKIGSEELLVEFETPLEGLLVPFVLLVPLVKGSDALAKGVGDAALPAWVLLPPSVDDVSLTPNGPQIPLAVG